MQPKSKLRDPLRVGAASDAATGIEPHVCVETALGHLVIAVLCSRAPRTAANFLSYVDGHYLDGSSIYRIVTPDNENPPPAISTSVVQWGMSLREFAAARLPPVAHEPTSITGLRHRHGAVSLARFAPGTGASEFFFCIGDQPQLDYGGRRNPDGAGFAVFGQVVAGESVLAEIYARAESDHLLKRPIRIDKVQRLAPNP